jgi:hypothetical protein
VDQHNTGTTAFGHIERVIVERVPAQEGLLPSPNGFDKEIEPDLDEAARPTINPGRHCQQSVRAKQSTAGGKRSPEFCPDTGIWPESVLSRQTSGDIGEAGTTTPILYFSLLIQAPSRRLLHVEFVAHADVEVTRNHGDGFILRMIVSRDFVVRRHFQPNNIRLVR